MGISKPFIAICGIILTAGHPAHASSISKFSITNTDVDLARAGIQIMQGDWVKAQAQASVSWWQGDGGVIYDDYKIELFDITFPNIYPNPLWLQTDIHKFPKPFGTGLSISFQHVYGNTPYNYPDPSPGFHELSMQLSASNNSNEWILISSKSASFEVLPSAVTPIPEPETYAMMLAGLGLLGVVARRRKQNSAI